MLLSVSRERGPGVAGCASRVSWRGASALPDSGPLFFLCLVTDARLCSDVGDWPSRFTRPPPKRRPRGFSAPMIAQEASGEGLPYNFPILT